MSDSEQAFHQRKLKAWAAATRLSKVANSKAAEQLKVRLFRATVESVLLFAAETLAVSPTLSKKIDSAHSSLLRYSLGIHWPQLVSNEVLFGRTQCP